MKKQILLYTVALSCVVSSSFGGASTIQFQAANFEASELQSGHYFTLTCTPPAPSDVTVRVQVGFLTASPEDIILAEGKPPELEVGFASGASEARGNFWFLRDDGLPEEDETISLSLGAITGPAILGDRTNATLLIKNAAPAFELHGTNGAENAPFAFEIWRRGDTNVAVSLDYRVTTNSTAVSGVDFIPGDGRVLFAPGEISKAVVALRDNGEVSSPLTPRKMIELEVSNPSANATILDPSVVQLEIRDNEIPATLDPNFSPDFGRWPGITSVAVQPDGRILVAGYSLFIGNTQRALVRLNADGSLDGSFQPDFHPREPGASVAILPSGKIMVRYDDRGLLRLLPDGRRDSGFVPAQETLNALSALPWSLKTLRSGKLLVGGYRIGFAVLVLNEDGSEDEALQGRLRQHEFFDFVELSDGKLLLMRNAIWTDERRLPPLVRLQADGSADPTFQPPETIRGSAGSVLPLTDGTIIAESVENSSMVRLVRLLPDGSLDPNFHSSLSEGRLVPYFEKEGKIYVGKAGPGGVLSHLLRMNPDGSPDPSFYAESILWIHPLAGVSADPPPTLPHQDGILRWSGTWANGVPRPLARIIPDAPAAFVFRDSLDGWFSLAFAAPTRAFEADGAVEIKVVRTGNTSGPASIRFRTQDGTALAGQNYIAAAGMLEFALFQTEAVIRITLLQDDVFRGRPHFFLALHDPSVAARFDRPRQIVVHDREPGLVAGRVFTRLDGRKEMEFDVTGLHWGDAIHIEASADLRQWTMPIGSGRQFGPTKGSFWLVPESAPELLEVGPAGNQFFRMVR